MNSDEIKSQKFYDRYEQSKKDWDGNLINCPPLELLNEIQKSVSHKLAKFTKFSDDLVQIIDDKTTGTKQVNERNNKEKEKEEGEDIEKNNTDTNSFIEYDEDESSLESSDEGFYVDGEDDSDYEDYSEDDERNQEGDVSFEENEEDYKDEEEEEIIIQNKNYQWDKSNNSKYDDNNSEEEINIQNNNYNNKKSQLTKSIRTNTTCRNTKTVNRYPLSEPIIKSISNFNNTCSQAILLSIGITFQEILIETISNFNGKEYCIDEKEEEDLEVDKEEIKIK